MSAPSQDQITTDLEGAAAILQAHPETVRSQAAAGIIPGRKVGRAWVFIVQDLLDFIRQGYSGPALGQRGPQEEPHQWNSNREEKTASITAVSRPQVGAEYLKVVELATTGRRRNTP